MVTVTLAARRQNLEPLCAWVCGVWNHKLEGTSIKIKTGHICIAPPNWIYANSCSFALNILLLLFPDFLTIYLAHFHMYSFLFCCLLEAPWSCYFKAVAIDYWSGKVTRISTRLSISLDFVLLFLLWLFRCFLKVKILNKCYDKHEIWLKSICFSSWCLFTGLWEWKIMLHFYW